MKRPKKRKPRIKPRLRKKEGSSRMTIPKKWQVRADIGRKVLQRLQEEGKIKEYRETGPQIFGNTYCFEVLFFFWERWHNINIFLSKNHETCSLTMNELKSFDIMLGEDAGVEALYQDFCLWILICESGYHFEKQVVEDLKQRFQKTQPTLSVRPATPEEDQKEKKDIFIEEPGLVPVGIQIKTDVKNWLFHKRKHPDIPSILIPKKYDIGNLEKQILIIFNSFQVGRVEHINMKALLL